MYAKPTLSRFGTFRDLTQWGLASASDGGAIFGISGCKTEIGPYTLSIGCDSDGNTSS